MPRQSFNLNHFFKRLSKQRGLRTLLILGPLLPILFFLIRFTSPGEVGAWFNDNWLYRSSIPVTNNTTEESAVYVTVSLDTSDTDKFQGDAGDLRFTKLNGQLLPYYISSGVGTTATYINVYLDTLIADSSTLYYYYGNPSVDDGFSGTDFSSEASNYTIGSLGSEEQSPGPIAYWSLDEGYGTTAYDGTTQGNNGTLGTGDSAPTWATADMCKSGMCLEFDGVDDYTEITDNPIFTLEDSNDYTWSMWVKPLSFDEAFSYVWSQFIGVNYGFMIATHTTSNDAWGPVTQGISACWRTDGGGDGGANCTHTYDNTLSINNWYFITVTYTGSESIENRIQIYIDGIDKTDTSDVWSVDSSMDINPTNIYIGSPDTNEYHGFIDEVKIYPYVRSAAEITQDAMLPGTVQGASASFGSPSTAHLNEGLVGYWKMDETSWDGSADEVIDSSGNANHGIAVGATAPPTTDTGKFGNGGSFDGSEDYVTIDQNFKNTLNSFTASQWIKANETDGSRPIYHSLNGEEHYPRAYILDGKIRFQFRDTDMTTYTITTDDVVISPDIWHHVTTLYNANTNKAFIYVNGTLIKNTKFPATTLNGSSSYDLKIGQSNDLGGAFDGTLDEVRIYNRALTPTEVQDLYNWAPGPVGHWKMDEKTGSSAYDTSGGGFTGSFSGTPSWQSAAKCKIGACLDLDVSDYVTINSSTPTITEGVTIEAWVKQDETVSFPQVAFRSNAFLLRIDSGEPIFWVHVGGDDNYEPNVGSNVTLTDNNWYHLAGVYDGSTIKIYVNGQYKNSTNRSGTMDSSSGTILFGNGLDGSIDDVRIYNYARTQAQIIEDMNGGIGGAPSGQILSSNSPVGYWKFDEGYGTTANDSGFGGNNGTLGTGDSAPSWTNSGKIGKALNFTGDNDYVVISDPSYTDATEYLTVSLWMKANTLTNNDTFVHKFDTTIDDGWALQVGTNNQNILVAVSDDGGDYGYTINDPISTGSWYHMLFVYDGTGANNSDRLKLYINGEQQSLQFSGTILTSTPQITTDLFIGASSAKVRFFDGLIDEVKIYNFSLTKSQVLQNYNQGKSAVMGSLSTDSSGNPSFSAADAYCPPGQGTGCTAPIAHWTFDEKTGTTAYDISENSNNGTLTNMESTDWKSLGVCKQGACLDFDGVDETITVTDSGTSPLDLSSNGTLEIWAKSDREYPSDSGSGFFRNFISKSPGGQAATINYAFHWYGTDSISNLRLCLSDDTNLDCDTYNIGALAIGEWNHYATSWNGTNVKWYVNGRLIETDDNTVTCQLTDTDFHIGGCTFGCGSTFNWDGSLDNAIVYDYARTQAQIAWDYNRGQPVGWWKFDEAEGTTAYDAMGSNNGSLGTGDSAPTWTTSGKRNGALTFDGTNDYAEHETTTIKDETEITVSFWAKTSQTTASSGRAVVSKGDPNGWDDFVIGLGRTTNCPDDVILYFVTDSGDSNNRCGNVTFNDDIWHHVVWTWTSSNGEWNIYFDGILTNNGTRTGNYLLDTDDTLTFASYTAHTTNSFFEGLIDEVKIWNYALTAQQVKLEYNQGAVNF
jgi:concanavalin A-like lectin/glucanase superfamily protein/uncharacterized protein DUF2341